MENGKWIPVCKNLVTKLPKGRPYSEVEAIYSLTVDYDNRRSVSVAGLAKLWCWNRKRVSTFLKKIGVEIMYPKCTLKIQNQRGQIGVQIRPSEGADRSQIRFINSRQLRDIGNRSRTDTPQKGSRSGSTTKRQPNPNNNT
jgi:hypothetical protein